MLFRNYLKVVILGQTIDITRGPILVFPNGLRESSFL